MNILRLLPVIFSFLILSAHFSRGDLFVFSIIFLFIPLLLFIKNGWVVRTIQILLICGSIEWVRSLFIYISQRQTMGEPYLRLVIIIGIVALFTGLSALVFRNSALKERYKL
jgi:hypothetical protein